MTDERWDQFIEMAKGKFQNVSVRQEDLLGPTGEVQGKSEVVKLTIPGMGDFQVVRENRPVVLDKKMHYSHRQGDTARTEYVLSDTEFSHKVRVYKDVDDEWEEISADTLGL